MMKTSLDQPASQMMFPTDISSGGRHYILVQPNHFCFLSFVQLSIPGYKSNLHENAIRSNHKGHCTEAQDLRASMLGLVAGSLR